LLVVFSAITRELLKVHPQVKHCKKGLREIFQVSAIHNILYLSPDATLA